MLLSPTNLGSAASTHTSKAQHKRAHGRGAAEVLHDKSELRNSYERHTDVDGGTQTSMCTENKTNLDRQVGVRPSAAALRVDRSESHCPPRWSLADTSTGWCPLLSHLHPRSHRQTHTHTHKQKATLASAFQAQGPENIINTLSNEDWHPAGWSGRSRHKALTCTLGLEHQHSVHTCACTVQSEVATGQTSSTSTDSFVDG